MSDYGQPSAACGPVDATKDADDISDLSFHWAKELAGDTIDTSTFLLPDGLTEDDSSTSGSATTIRLSGGDCGKVYRVTNRIVTDDGRQFDKTKRVAVRER